jgi:hypothetical protein
MGKKKSGNTYVSKGQRPNVARRWTKNPSYSQSFERLENVQKAYNEGRPISEKTLLAFGPRNSGETAKFNELRKAR